MITMYDVDAQDLVRKAAEEMKKIPEIKPPAWATFAKTGMHKERPPVESDWWYIRSASVLRTVYRLGPVGVSKLRTKYGGKKNRGVAAEHSYRGSGSIIRTMMQQMEKAGLVTQASKGLRRGRILTSKGSKFLNNVARKMGSGSVAPKAYKPAAEVAKAEPKVETRKTSVKKPKEPKAQQNA